MYFSRTGTAIYNLLCTYTDSAFSNSPKKQGLEPSSGDLTFQVVFESLASQRVHNTLLFQFFSDRTTSFSGINSAK